MYVDISELAREPYGEEPFHFEVDAAELSLDSEDYEIRGTVVVDGKVSVSGGRFRVEGTISCVKSFLCDRCLKPSEEEQQHPFSEEYAADATEENGFNKLTGESIDLVPLVRDTVIAAQPIAKLCKPDCKGLCPVCGQDLNEGTCDCDTFVPDPRLAALKSLLTDTSDEDD